MKKLLVIFVLICLCICTMTSCSKMNDMCMFKNFDECKALKTYESDTVEITEYTSPSKDKYYKNYEYNEFWGMKYKSKDLKFIIFAYEYKDKNDALRYFVNVTGKALLDNIPLDDEEYKNFSTSRGMFSYRIIVIQDNKAYIVKAPCRYGDKIEEMLSENFSVVVFKGQG